jgi:ABC-type branched-subunit amino acid transport system substrate-binding protein
LEFYEGALLAVDALRNKGLSIELSVFDTSADSVMVDRIIDSGALDDVDLIIGPVYSYNVEKVAKYARNRRIPVVSPLASMNPELLRSNPYLFKIQPSKEVVESAIASTVANFYDHNIIFVHSDTAYNRENSSEFRNKILRQLRYKVPFNEIRTREVFFVSRSNYNDTINIIAHAMTKDIPNLVVVASDDEAVMSEVLVNVHTLLRKFNIKVIGYPDLMWLNNLEPIYYYELGLILYTPNYVDYSQTDVIDFLKRYRDLFNTEPPVRSYAWQAYDITYFFVSGVAVQGNDFKYRPTQHRPDLLQVDYDFKRSGLRNGFENRRLYLIRYKPDYSIEFIRE